MVLRTDLERLQSAWRALAGESKDDGWRTIPIGEGRRHRVFAGRHFPGDEEAVLVGFNSVKFPTDDHLPQGRGFRVKNVKQDIPGGTEAWVSLSRQSAGSLDMFARMAEDVISMLQSQDYIDDEMLFLLFLGRIRAWQEFMEKGRDDVLRPEAEVGLFGELTVLKMVLEAQVSADMALDSWHGPLGELHDFRIGGGAIEVKSTVAETGFPATVGSLEQLDESLVQPLYLAGIRLSLDNSGSTLPEFVADLRSVLSANLLAQGMFESLVLRAGFLWAFSGSYRRRFMHTDTLVIPVRDNFPKLIRGNVNIAIRKVRYELDLALVNIPDIGLNQALHELGVA